jgi:hypothetical protein
MGSATRVGKVQNPWRLRFPNGILFQPLGKWTRPHSKRRIQCLAYQYDNILVASRFWGGTLQLVSLCYWWHIVPNLKITNNTFLVWPACCNATSISYFCITQQRSRQLTFLATKRVGWVWVWYDLHQATALRCSTSSWWGEVRMLHNPNHCLRPRKPKFEDHHPCFSVSLPGRISVRHMFSSL